MFGPISNRPQAKEVTRAFSSNHEPPRGHRRLPERRRDRPTGRADPLNPGRQRDLASDVLHVPIHPDHLRHPGNAEQGHDDGTRDVRICDREHHGHAPRPHLPLARPARNRQAPTREPVVSTRGLSLTHSAEPP